MPSRYLQNTSKAVADLSQLGISEMKDYIVPQLPCSSLV